MGLCERLAEFVEHKYGDEKDAGNGRLALNLVEAAVTSRASRVFKAFEAAAEDDESGAAPGIPEASSELIADDFELNKRIGDETLQQSVESEIANIIGMDKAKLWFAELKKKVRIINQTGDRSALKMALNVVLTGNPGTGTCFEETGDCRRSLGMRTCDSIASVHQARRRSREPCFASCGPTGFSRKIISSRKMPSS